MTASRRGLDSAGGKKYPVNTHIIKEDFLKTMNKEYLGIIESAIRTTLSGTPWKVVYHHYPSFLFEGKIVLCTSLTEGDIKKLFYRPVVILSSCLPISWKRDKVG